MIYFSVIQVKKMIEGLPDDAIIEIKPVIQRALVRRLEAHPSGVSQSAAETYDIARHVGKQELQR